MTNKDYQERFQNLYTRLQCAIRLHCTRTAKARLRDIANLEHELRPSIPYQVLLDKLTTKYLGNKNI